MKKQKAGTRASIRCKVTPKNDYKIEWKFKGGEIQAKAKTDELKKTLDIPFITLDDAGTYLCRMTDILGQTKEAATVLEVMGMSRF